MTKKPVERGKKYISKHSIDSHSFWHHFDSKYIWGIQRPHLFIIYF